MPQIPSSIAEAEAELADLERKIAEISPMQARANSLRHWIGLTQSLFGKPAEMSSVAEPAEIGSTVPSVFSTMKPATQKEKILRAAEAAFLAEGPMSSRPMVELIEKAGVEIGGADKSASLASILSRADNWISDKEAGGWRRLNPGEVKPGKK